MPRDEDFLFRRFGPGPGPGFGPGGFDFERPVPGPGEGMVFLKHRGPGPMGGFRRRFRTRDERIAELEAYLRELEAEAQGVREALERLRQRQQPPSQP